MKLCRTQLVRGVVFASYVVILVRGECCHPCGSQNWRLKPPRNLPADQQNMIYFLEWHLSKWKKSSEQLARYFKQNRPSMHEQTTCAWQLWLTPLNGGGTWFRKEYYYRLSLLPHPNSLPQSRPVHFSLLLHFSSCPLSESLEQAMVELPVVVHSPVTKVKWTLIFNSFSGFSYLK